MKKFFVALLLTALSVYPALADSVFVPPITTAPITAQLSRASATALVTATPKTITSVSLTPGTWIVTGTVSLTGSTPVGTTFIGGITTSTNAYPLESSRFWEGSVNLSVDDMQITPPVSLFTVSVTTSVFLTAGVTFASGAANAYGSLLAWQIR